MTGQIDTAFATAVRAALADRVRAVTARDRGDLSHRDLAERVKALVAAARLGVGPAGADLLGRAGELAARLSELQGPGGLFAGGDNVDSPPDSAFSVNDLADALLLLRQGGAAGALGTRLAHLLDAATPALLSGGVHTPNHRWELCAALARLFRLGPEPAVAARVAARVGEWLAEGVDIDGDGLYSERSANYAAHVSNPALLTLAGVFDRPELVTAVERNLAATLDLLLPDGCVETVLSRRQDQHRPLPLAPYLLPLRRVALLRGRGDLAWAAGIALAQGIDAPAEAATQLLLDPGIAHPLPAPVAPCPARRRVFAGAGLLVNHRPNRTVVLFGGSDHPRHGRIRSGLANSPTFLRLYAGAAVLTSARLSRTFFGLGPFRGDGLTVRSDTVTLTERVAAGYYQPLAPADRDARGAYGLGDEGRFSAAMDFDRRTRDEVALSTSVEARLTADGVQLTLDMAGAAVDWALELAFRPGGTMTGAFPLGAQRWQLAAPGSPAEYRVGPDAVAVTLLDPLPVALSAPGYEPGEEYRFLGGTDAATGELLYVPGRCPTRVRLLFTASRD